MDAQVIVVAGTNKKLIKWLKKIQALNLKKMLVFEFVEHIEELMEIATVVITKPGGMTTSEALTKGGVLITAHLGNWEMGAVIVSKLGHSVTVVALPHKERDVNTFFNKQRESRGMTIVPTSTAIRQCLETLRENKFTALAADRDFSLNGEVMDFLGRKAFIPKGPAAFSIKTGAPIVPVFLIRQESNNFVLHFEEPIWPGENGNEHNAQLNLMYKYVRIMEDKIRQNPEQWMVFREFWVDENKYFYSSNKEQNDQ